MLKGLRYLGVPSLSRPWPACWAFRGPALTIASFEDPTIGMSPISYMSRSEMIRRHGGHHAGAPTVTSTWTRSRRGRMHNNVPSPRSPDRRRVGLHRQLPDRGDDRGRVLRVPRGPHPLLRIDFNSAYWVRRR